MDDHAYLDGSEYLDEVGHYDDNAELARDTELDLENDFLIYTKWNETLSLSRAGQEVPIRVQLETTLEEVKRRALAKFDIPEARTTPLEYIVFYFKGRRLLDDALTVGEVGIKENDSLIIHWH